ncbi:MAG: peptidoglycan DD-metalloendopeptidase family protein, partial [Acidobacteriota bacterium]
MRIYRNREGAFRSRMEQIPYEIKLVRLNVTVRVSFMRSIVEAGGSPQIAMEMAEIFEWVIDFHKDLNEGDRIDALIERRFLYGRPSGFGRILSARFAVGKKTHEAVYFARGSEVYYTPEGKSLRRAFLRSPLRYTRISSRFSKRRLHPILRRYRPHYGVDYAAPRGTPVRAVADGQVVWASWKGAAGKMVRIRHERSYTTEYLHLSGFARGMRRGKRVAQGKVIGYVGSTGLSTGPHLDFRIKHFGRPVDPIS